MMAWTAAKSRLAFAHRLEGPPQVVEREPVPQLGVLEQLDHYRRDSIPSVLADIGITARPDEEEVRIGLVLRCDPLGKSVPERCHGFRPERYPARNASLLPGVVEPLMFEVNCLRRQQSYVSVPECSVDAQQNHGLAVGVGVVE